MNENIYYKFNVISNVNAVGQVRKCDVSQTFHIFSASMLYFVYSTFSFVILLISLLTHEYDAEMNILSFSLFMLVNIQDAMTWKHTVG